MCERCSLEDTMWDCCHGEKADMHFLILFLGSLMIARIDAFVMSVKTVAICKGVLFASLKQ